MLEHGLKRNNTSIILLGLLAVGSIMQACTPADEMSITLRRPIRPDPFADVERIRIRAASPQGLVDLGHWRWDQGPIEIADRVPIDTERVLVEGIDQYGSVVSSGITQRFNLTQGNISNLDVFFSRIGDVSQLARKLPNMNKPQLVEIDGARRALIVSRATDKESAGRLNKTYWLDLDSKQVTPGPNLSQVRSATATWAEDKSAGESYWVGGTSMWGTDTLLGIRLRRDGSIDITDNSKPFKILPGAAVLSAVAGVRTYGGGSSPYTSLFNFTRGQAVRGKPLKRPRYNASALNTTYYDYLVGGRDAVGGQKLDTISLVGSDGDSNSTLKMLGAREKPALTHSPAGTLYVSGGADSGKPGANLVEAVVVKSFEPEGDVSIAYKANESYGSLDTRQMLHFGDGSLLLLDGQDTSSWLRFIPNARTTLFNSEPSLGFVYANDGTAVLIGQDTGMLLSFNPGLSALYGPALVNGDLRQKVITDDSENASSSLPSLGLIPLRPKNWKQTAAGVVVSANDLNEQISPQLPAEYALVGSDTYRSFRMQIKMVLDGAAKPFILFNLTSISMMALELSPTTSVYAKDGLGTHPPTLVPNCTAQIPEFGRPGTYLIDLRVKDGKLQVDLNGDGSIELSCPLGDRYNWNSGGVGWGVGAGPGSLRVESVHVSSN